MAAADDVGERVARLLDALQRDGLSPERTGHARRILLALCDALERDAAAAWERIAAAAALLDAHGARTEEDSGPSSESVTDPIRPMAPALITRIEAPPLAPDELVAMRAGEPPMTLARYAALCASCGAMPGRLDETLTRFGVADRAARTALDVAWRTRFDEEPALRELYDVLFARLRAWLIQYGSV
jgi:hypothetical protein